MQELKPDLSMFLFVFGSFQEQARDLFIAIFLGLRRVIGVFVARLGLARKCCQQVGFGLDRKSVV